MHSLSMTESDTRTHLFPTQDPLTCVSTKSPTTSPHHPTNRTFLNQYLTNAFDNQSCHTTPISNTSNYPPNRSNLMTSYSPYKYINSQRRTNTQSINDVKIIRIRRNKYRKFRFIRPTYVKNSKNILTPT